MAEASPGFVWRLQTPAGNATAYRPYDNDDRILMNLSVWETPEQLREFVYRTVHVEVMRQRKSWFERFDGPYLALWWVPAGDIPSIDEATEYRSAGPSFAPIARSPARRAWGSTRTARIAERSSITLPSPTA